MICLNDTWLSSVVGGVDGGTKIPLLLQKGILVLDDTCISFRRGWGSCILSYY